MRQANAQRRLAAQTLRLGATTIAAIAPNDSEERFTAMGVPRFVYTDVARDGMLQGPNVDMLRRVADATSAAVTASGGVSSLEDLATLATCHERVDAAIVGKALYSGAFTLEEALAAVDAA